MLPALAIPMAIQAAQGLYGIFKGAAQQGKGNSLFNSGVAKNNAIPLNDPQQMAFLDDVRGQEQAMFAGTSKLMGVRTRLAQQGLAQTQANLGRGAGGSAGAFLDGALGAQRNADIMLNEGAATESQQALGLMNLRGGLIDTMAQRRLARQDYLRDLDMSRGAQFTQDGSANIAGGIGSLASAGMDAAYMFGEQ